MYNIWTIDTEFKKLQYSKLELDDNFISFMNKWIHIMLLRDNDFFKSNLSEEHYLEFITKINNYQLKYGSSNGDISLYFIGYEFSDDLSDKILTIRNYYGIVLISLLAFPSESFTGNLKIFSNELKKINNNFNLQILLQEIAFDLGCSSYAIGKIYDYIIKVCNINTTIDNDKFKNYCNSNNYIFESDNNDLDMIQFIKNKKQNYLPLDFVIPNNVLSFFIYEFFKI